MRPDFIVNYSLSCSSMFLLSRSLFHGKQGLLLVLVCKGHTIKLTAPISCTSREQTMIGHLRVFFSFRATGIAI